MAARSHQVDAAVRVDPRLVGVHGDDGDAHVDSQDVQVEETEKRHDGQQIATRERSPGPLRRNEHPVIVRLHGDDCWAQLRTELCRNRFNSAKHLFFLLARLHGDDCCAEINSTWPSTLFFY